MLAAFLRLSSGAVGRLRRVTGAATHLAGVMLEDAAQKTGKARFDVCGAQRHEPVHARCPGLRQSRVT